MSESIFCDICDKVLSQQKGEYNHGCLDCHGQPYSDKIFWLRKSLKQMAAELAAKDEELIKAKELIREMRDVLDFYSNPYKNWIGTKICQDDHYKTTASLGGHYGGKLARKTLLENTDKIKALLGEE